MRLADVLRDADVSAKEGHLRVRGADVPQKPAVPAFVRDLPLDRALDPSTLIAYRMNGEPLSHAHGAPMRLVVPGWSGNHWMKWLVELEVQQVGVTGFYQEKAYRMPKAPVEPGASVAPEDTLPATTFPVKSVIGRPLEGARAKAGRQEVAGVAFSGRAAIESVEVSVDGGASWRLARLEGEASLGRWQVFRHVFTARRPGTYAALARATDAEGNVQPERAAWNPSGYFHNGWHRVSWEVVA